MSWGYNIVSYGNPIFISWFVNRNTTRGCLKTTQVPSPHLLTTAIHTTQHCATCYVWTGDIKPRHAVSHRFYMVVNVVMSSYITIYARICNYGHAI